MSEHDSKSLRAHGQLDLVVGHSYRCTDGIIRRIVHRSKRGFYHVHWLKDEGTDWEWHIGGRMRESDLREVAVSGLGEIGGELPLVGPTGVLSYPSKTGRKE